MKVLSPLARLAEQTPVARPSDNEYRQFRKEAFMALCAAGAISPCTLPATIDRWLDQCWTVLEKSND